MTKTRTKTVARSLLERGGKLRKFYVYLVLLFLFLPIFILVFFSFNESKLNVIFTGFTFDWYGKLFQNPDLLDAFKNTLFVAVTSTAVSTVLGILGAVGLQKFRFHGKAIVDKLIYIPIVIPEIVLGIALLSVFTLTNLELSLWTVLLAHISFSVPFVITSIRSTLYALPKNLEEAASDLGASRWQAFFKVTLPLIMPGVISGALLAFTLSLDDVVISYFAAGPGTNTLPLYIYANIKTGISPDVNALTTLMLIFTIITLTLSAHFQSKRTAKRSAL
ncbi:ABC transporter permease [Candidatus Saccharibacteria bacterium]|nr:ABC transporter permease [Candidatus Saccharibacteria bacterium]